MSVEYENAGEERDAELIPKERMAHTASKIHFWSGKDDAPEYRERLVQASAQMIIRLGEYLKECDSIIIDQNSANLLGTFFEEVAGLSRGDSPFVVHDGIVPSRKRPNRIEGLEQDIREAYVRGTMGNRILIVTEHADTGETCETLARITRETGHEFGKDPEIRIAALSVHPTKFFDAHASSKDRPEQWVWGEKGTIGSSAFRREDLAVTHEEMAMLAQELAPLVSGKQF